MSALNITATLPQTRASDTGSSKPADTGADDGFGGVFRDLSQGKKDSGQASDTSKPADAAASTDTSKSAETAKPEGQTRSLADTLAQIARQRAEGSGDETSDGGTGNGQSGDESATAEQAADADAAKDVAKDVADEKRMRQMRDRATTNRQMEAQAVARRMEGLTALLFGRQAGETGVGMGGDVAENVTLTGDGLKGALADKADKADSTDTAQDTEAQATVVANPILSLAALLPAKDQVTTLQPEAGGEAAAGSAAQLVASAGDTETTATRQSLQINVLSRETHFQPIRTLGLNGGSAPTEQGQTAPGTAAMSLSAAGLPADGSSGTTTSAGSVKGRTAAETQILAAALPGTRTAATGEAANTVIGETDAEAQTAGDTPRTSARTAATDIRSRETAARTRTEASATTAQTSREAARADVSQSQNADASAARAESDAALPMTGAAGIAPGAVPSQELPALKQIGAAIAAEANTMGQASASVASANSTTAEALAGPVRLLQIQLKPDDLGTVNVRMRLSGSGLEIQLRASNADTARMLERDRAALSDLLSASGIAADSITIVGIDSGGSMQLTGQDAGRPFTQSEASAQQADGQEQGASDQQGRQQQDENSQNGARNDDARSRSRAADAGDFRDFRI